MTKEEVLGLSLTAKQEAQLKRFFDAWDKLKKPSVFEAMTTQKQVEDYIDDAVRKYEKNQEKKVNKPKKRNSRDIQSLALSLCKGKDKKLTFDELYKFIETAATEKRKKEIANKKAALAKQLAELEAEEETLS